MLYIGMPGLTSTYLFHVVVSPAVVASCPECWALGPSNPGGGVRAVSSATAVGALVLFRLCGFVGGLLLSLVTAPQGFRGLGER